MEYCQSCAMPMVKEEYWGTNKDGSINKDYCIYCYKDGEFLHNVSMEEFIEMCVKFHDQANMTEEQMREHCQKIYPNLKRWKK